MFNLNDIIAQFNQLHYTKIKPNKTWRLFYLQPETLAFLNNSISLIQQSVYYASPFVSNRRELRAALVRGKEQSIKDIARLRCISQQLITDKWIVQRLDWEECLSKLLNNKSFGGQAIGQEGLRIKKLLENWKIHQPFQYHSSEGLLFLLDVIVKYQHHFKQALKELQKKQQAWFLCFLFKPLPFFIAKNYRKFITDKIKYLSALQEQVLDTMLLRLKIATQQNQVTCDDVSYSLAQQLQTLESLSHSIRSLPTYKMTRTSTTFYQMQRAIERQGNTSQKERLYQLAWYQLETLATKDITIFTNSPHRLLLPSALIQLMPKYYGKFLGFFTNNTKRFRFLETQQGLLAQLALPLEYTNLKPESVSIGQPILQSLMTRYQLLQESLQLLNCQRTHWWQWQQNHWKKVWQVWLSENVKRNQRQLLHCLADFFQNLQNREDLLSLVSYRQQIQTLLQSIQTLIDNDIPTHRSHLLSELLEQFSVLFQTKTIETSQQKHASISLIRRFKQDLLIALKNYIEHGNKQGNIMAEKQYSDFNHLWKLLESNQTIVELRENFIQHYRTMQPSFFKLIPSLDPNFLRCSLKAVLENPEYSIEAIKKASHIVSPLLVGPTACQENNGLSLSHNNT